MPNTPDERWSRLLAEHHERRDDLEAEAVPTASPRWDVDGWPRWKRWLSLLLIIVGGPVALGSIAYWKAQGWDDTDPFLLGVSIALFWFTVIGLGVAAQASKSPEHPRLSRLRSAVERVLGVSPTKRP